MTLALASTYCMPVAESRIGPLPGMWQSGTWARCSPRKGVIQERRGRVLTQDRQEEEGTALWKMNTLPGLQWQGSPRSTLGP